MMGLSLSFPAGASDFTAPEVLESGRKLMPQAQTLSEGIGMILRDLLPLLRPDLYEATRVGLALIATTMLGCVVDSFSGPVKKTVNVACTAAVGTTLLLSANSLIRLGADTIRDMTQYGKLLLPVLTGALAAQGAVGTSSALYAGTAGLIAVIGSVVSGLLVPMVYFFLALAVAAGATEGQPLRHFRDLMKDCVSWCLKMILTGFITYMGITGVISGTADALAIKAARVTISAAVPVVGGILSEASEAVVISMGLAKNAAGLYGIFAVLAMFLEPFVKLCCHYLVFRFTAAVCGIFGSKTITEVIGDFSAAMGLLMGMTGAVCLMLLISTVCFLKGVT